MDGPDQKLVALGLVYVDEGVWRQISPETREAVVEVFGCEPLHEIYLDIRWKLSLEEWPELIELMEEELYGIYWASMEEWLQGASGEGKC